MTILASLFSALKSLGALSNLLESLVSEVKNLRMSLEQKNLEQLKNEIGDKLKQLEVAKTDEERKRAIVDISKRLG
jgi:hypothetical protein